MKICLSDEKLRRAIEALADRYHREIVPDLTEDEVCEIVENDLPELLEFLINDMIDDARSPKRMDDWLEKELIDDLKRAAAKKNAEKKMAAAVAAATTYLKDSDSDPRSCYLIYLKKEE